MKMFNDKKGNYRDVPEYMKNVVIVFFAIMMGYLILSNFNSGVQANPVFDNETQLTSQSYNDSFLKLDYVIPFMYLVFLGFSVVAARFIPSSSKFMIVTVAFLILIPFIGMFTDNITNAMIANGTLLGSANNFPLGKFFFTNITLFATIYSLLVGFALLTKGEKQQ